MRIGSRAQSQERIVNCHLSQATLWRVRARAAKPWRNAAGWCGAQAQPRMAPAAPVRIHLVRCGGSIAFQKPGLNRVTGPVMFIRSATRPGGAPVGVRFPDERSDFPHKRIFFPAPLKKFPVWWVQGIGSRDPRNVWCFGLWKRGSARNREIPCIFPWNREFGVGRRVRSRLPPQPLLRREPLNKPRRHRRIAGPCEFAFSAATISPQIIGCSSERASSLKHLEGSADPLGIITQSAGR